MAKHAVFSPSSAHRWSACLAAVAMEDGLVDDGNSYASQGTAEHFLGAFCLENDCDAKDCLGDEIAIDKEGEAKFLEKGLACDSSFEVDKEMAATVQNYVDYVRKVAWQYQGKIYVEVDVPIDHITGEEGATGRADAIVVSLSQIVVIDKKFKWGVEVVAENNDQFIMYASGALRKFSAELKREFTRVRLVAAQKAPYSEAETTPAAIALRCDELAVAAKTSRIALEFKSNWDFDAKHGYFNPGETQCMRCKAKADCPGLANAIEKAVGASLTDVDALTDASLVVAVEQTSLSEKMAVVGLVEDWCAAVRLATFRKLSAGVEVHGYKLVTGKKGNRAWRDEKEAELLFKKYRTKTEEMYALKLNGPAPMELFFANQPKRWAEVAKLITQAEGNPTVVPDTDKRPALDVKPVIDSFDNLDDTGDDLV